MNLINPLRSKFGAKRASNNEATETAPAAQTHPSAQDRLRLIESELQALEPVGQMYKQLRSLNDAYDRGIAALVAAQRLQKGWDNPQPQLHWTVQRELVVASEDGQAMAEFERQHGQAWRDEQAANARLAEQRLSAPARIEALENHLRGLARQMVQVCDESLLGRCGEQAITPAAQRLMQAAENFAQMWSEFQAVHHTLKQRLKLYHYSVNGTRLEPSDFTAVGRREHHELLPLQLATLPLEAIKAINERFRKMDDAARNCADDTLQALGLDNTRLKVYRVPQDIEGMDSQEVHERYPVYAPDPNPPKKRPDPADYGLAPISSSAY